MHHLAQRSVLSLLSNCLNQLHTAAGLNQFNGSATTAQTQHQVESGLLLDVVVAQGTSVLQLLASKDETLLVWIQI